MKNKLLIGTILILFVAIVGVNYKFFKPTKDANTISDDNGVVLSAKTLDEQEYSFKDKASKIPTRVENFYEPAHVWA